MGIKDSMDDLRRIMDDVRWLMAERSGCPELRNGDNPDTLAETLRRVDGAMSRIRARHGVTSFKASPVTDLKSSADRAISVLSLYPGGACGDTIFALRAKVALAIADLATLWACKHGYASLTHAEQRDAHGFVDHCQFATDVARAAIEEAG